MHPLLFYLICLFLYYHINLLRMFNMSWLWRHWGELSLIYWHDNDCSPRNENSNLPVPIKFLHLYFQINNWKIYWSWVGRPVLIVRTVNGLKYCICYTLGIFNTWYFNFMKWVKNCWLMPNEHFFALSLREQVTLDEMMIKTNNLSWIFIVLAHWNQKFAGRHVALLRGIILIAGQHVFAVCFIVWSDPPSAPTYYLPHLR